MSRRCRHHLSRLWAVLLVAGVLTTVFGGGAANAEPSPPPSGPHVEPVRAEEDNFDEAAAKLALAMDPVYIAPDALARLDRDRLREVTADGRVKVVAVPELASYRQVRDAFDKGYRRPGEAVLLLFGLRITVLADKPVYLTDSDVVLARHRRAVQQTYDMTAVVTDVVAKMRGRGPVAPVWRPKIVPAEPAQLAEIVRALELGGGYEHPEAPETLRDVSYVQRRHQTLAFRLVRMPVRTPDTPQPNLLGPLRKQFPDDVVVITWGDWLEAAGPDSGTVAAALASAAEDGSVDRLLSVVRGRRAGEVRDRPALVVPPAPAPVPRWPGLALVLSVGFALAVAVLLTGSRRRLTTLRAQSLAADHAAVAAARRRARMSTPDVPGKPRRPVRRSVWRRIVEARLPRPNRLRYVTLLAILALCGAVTAGLTFFAGSPETSVSQAIRDLRADSVAIRGPRVLDPARVRQLIGDRPIGVVVLPYGTNKADACDEIAAAHPTLLIVVYDNPYAGSACAGEYVPPLSGASSIYDAATTTLDAAENAAYDTRTRVKDATPAVERFIALVDAENPGQLPARLIPPAAPDRRGAIEWGLVALLVAVVVTITAWQVCPAIARWIAGRQQTSVRALRAELAALAEDLDQVSPGCPREVLRAAVRRYDTAAATLIYDRSALAAAMATHDITTARAALSDGDAPT